jgi:outer membrane protein assembly factor BamA
MPFRLRHSVTGLLVALIGVAHAAPAEPAVPAAADTPAAAAVPAAPLPSFAELQARGARIGEIRISARDIFDLDDPRENKLLFRWANAVHVNTRPGVIANALLFKTGEPVSAALIDETARVLRGTRYLHDVTIRPIAVHADNTVDIEVITRDAWTLDPGISFSRSGGASSSGIGLREYNLLGTGVGISLGRKKTIDRSSNELEIVHDRAFGGWTSIAYGHATNSDGSRNALSVAQPFYALDAPWSAGFTWVDDDRIDSVYRAGVIDSQYRHHLRSTEFVGGLSTGRVDGWVRRTSIGLSHQSDFYALEPGLAAPAQLPVDEKLVAPFVRLQLLEDDYRTLVNRNQVQRPETFAFGLDATLQIGRASTTFGSTRNAWLYSGNVSRAFDLGNDRLLVASSALRGQYADGSIRRQQLGLRTQLYLPQGPHWLFYASASADRLTHPGPTDELLLGGDNGLRGYPLRYQSGHRRALFTFEERAYSDIYLWQLFRLGGAVFVDVGRAWGGDATNQIQPGWLSNAGIGLRIFSVRAAFSNVLHLDVAVPNDPDVGVKKLQFNIKTKASF